MKKGQWEFKSFNNLYTQNKRFSNFNKVQTESRQRFITSINQFLYGVNPHLNVGIDLWIKNASSFNDIQGYLPEILVSKGSLPRTAVTGFGPKIKIAPFKNLNRFSIQSSVLFPLGRDLESRNSDRVFLEIDKNFLWLTQLFYDKPLGNDFQIFVQVAPWVTIPRDSFRKNVFIETPTSVFFSWFTNDRITVYAQNELWPTHYNDQSQSFEIIYSWFLQSGIGVKYQLIPGLLEAEMLYTNFWLGSDGQGAGETLNFGIRIIN